MRRVQAGFGGRWWTRLIAGIALASTGVAATANMMVPKVEFVDDAGAMLPAPPQQDFSPLGMYLAADGVVKTVIVALLVASLVTWTICFFKLREFSGQRKQVAAAFKSLLQARDLGSVGTVACQAVGDMIVNAEAEIADSKLVAGSAVAEGVKDRVAIRLERIEAAMGRRIGRFVGLLAIIGSTATFVGLFGTVWGVMNSFIGVAEAHTTNLAVVAPGIAEALLATATGLVAAVPAVVIYNLFTRTMASYRGELGDAGAMVLCLASREIDRLADGERG